MGFRAQGLKVPSAATKYQVVYSPLTLTARHLSVGVTHTVSSNVRTDIHSLFFLLTLSVSLAAADFKLGGATCVLALAGLTPFQIVCCKMSAYVHSCGLAVGRLMASRNPL